MKFDTTIRKMELTVEKTETFKISRIKRIVSERCNGDAQDSHGILDLALKEIVAEESMELSEQG